jgi:uncharacterized MAPEG superfamily protein
MPGELKWLMLTVILTGLLWIPYVLDRIIARGLVGAMANPSPGLPAQAAWAERLKAAHYNNVENLVIFAALVLTLNALHISTWATVAACAAFFWARLAYVIIYTLGLPVLRTLAFTVGFLAQVTLALVLLGAM